ncbi:MAG: EAL domain-containing protein, partial [Alphaproteobacteria bacterium]
AFLCRWFDLETDYDALLRLATDLAAGAGEAERGAPERETQPAVVARPSPPRRGPPRGYVSLVKEAQKEPASRALDAEALARLERTLAGADLGRFLMRRPVCLVSGETARQTVMRDIDIDRDALAKTVMPGYDLGAELWFAARLGEHFARHLLTLAPPIEAGSLLAVLLRTSLGAIASAEFTQFVEGLDRARRRSLVLAVPAAEALLRPLRYLRAREKIAEFGLRCALTGFDPLALVLHDPDLLPADFLILDGRRLAAWDASDVDSYPVLCGRIRNMDPARLVLEGCDDEDMLARGRRLGIRLFEGALFGRA